MNNIKNNVKILSLLALISQGIQETAAMQRVQSNNRRQHRHTETSLDLSATLRLRMKHSVKIAAISQFNSRFDEIKFRRLSNSVGLNGINENTFQMGEARNINRKLKRFIKSFCKRNRLKNELRLTTKSTRIDSRNRQDLINAFKIRYNVLLKLSQINKFGCKFNKNSYNQMLRELNLDERLTHCSTRSIIRKNKRFKQLINKYANSIINIIK